MIAVLGRLADVERDLIRTRTAEGRSRAKALGQHMGRPQQQQEARQRRAGGATLKRPCPLLQRQYGHDFEAQDMSAVTLSH
jgi:DNA invertase Pin-like site-specific DNA recombinase